MTNKRIFHTSFFFLLLASRGNATIARVDEGESRLSSGLAQLEQKYVEDCKENLAPHGFYGAFFQPCEFSFFDGPCSEESSTLLGSPQPSLHWFFQLQNHIDNNDWDELSSDDMPHMDDLLLWPDQCVGVVPRCYSISDQQIEKAINQSSAIVDTLQKLFPDGTPEGSTHVQVDCRSDAFELSRVAYSVASGVDEGISYVLGFVFMIILLHVLVISLCCFGCFRFCSNRQSGKDQQVYHAIPVKEQKSETMAVTGLVNDSALELSEKKHKYYDSV